MADDKYEFEILELSLYLPIEEMETELNAMGENKWVLWNIVRRQRTLLFFFSKKKP